MGLREKRGNLKPFVLTVLFCISAAFQTHAADLAKKGYHAIILSSDLFSGTYSVNGVINTISPATNSNGDYVFRINLPETGSYDFSVTIEPGQRTTFIFYYDADLLYNKTSSSGIMYSASLTN